MSNESYGEVKTQYLKVDEPFALECGATLPFYQLAYQTYGKLNADRSNALLVCHALSGNQHVTGWEENLVNGEKTKEWGWWRYYVGPNRPIDTNNFFVVAVNCIGGCSGSTGPTSINPNTNRAYGADFPIVTCKDWVKTQLRLMEHIGIKYWQVGVGASLGGMQILQWTLDYPHLIKNAVLIATAAKLTAQNIAYNEIARRAIMSDNNFHNGNYLQHGTTPKNGVKLARMLGHVTYLSDGLLKRKFGRELRQGKMNFSLDTQFEIESYLDYQGQKFVDKLNFDANTYLLMTRALDFFDPAKDFNNSLVNTLAKVCANFLVISFSSDWRFDPNCSLEIVRALMSNNKNVSYLAVKSEYGHDSFLIQNEQYERALAIWLNKLLQQN